MDKIILVGRLTRSPKVGYISGDSPMAVARYTLAVNRRPQKGVKMIVTGHIKTGSYTNRDGFLDATDGIGERLLFN